MAKSCSDKSSPEDQSHESQSNVFTVLSYSWKYCHKALHA